jgi:diketogulonate reductase-like aldo/keto reductase
VERALTTLRLRKTKDKCQSPRDRGALDVGTAKQISKIGLGTHQFGSAEWGYDERYARQEARVIVRRALELGVTLFDT